MCIGKKDKIYTEKKEIKNYFNHPPLNKSTENPLKVFHK